MTICISCWIVYCMWFIIYIWSLVSISKLNIVLYRGPSVGPPGQLGSCVSHPHHSYFQRERRQCFRRENKQTALSKLRQSTSYQHHQYHRDTHTDTDISIIAGNDLGGSTNKLPFSANLDKAPCIGIRVHRYLYLMTAIFYKAEQTDCSPLQTALCSLPLFAYQLDPYVWTFALFILTFLHHSFADVSCVCLVPCLLAYV